LESFFTRFFIQGDNIRGEADVEGVKVVFLWRGNTSYVFSNEEDDWVKQPRPQPTGEVSSDFQKLVETVDQLQCNETEVPAGFFDEPAANSTK